MILTIRVPDETVKISYAVLGENGYRERGRSPSSGEPFAKWPTRTRDARRRGAGDNGNDVLLTVGDMIRVEPDEKTAEQGGMDEKPCDKIGFE